MDTNLHFAVNGISTFESTLSRSRWASSPIIAPISTPLAIWTISGHMTSIPANSADDTRGEIALFGAVVFAMTNLTTYRNFSICPFNTAGANHKAGALTVLTSLVLVITQRSVKRRKFSELGAFKFVLALGN